jgi:hypothetical protein
MKSHLDNERLRIIVAEHDRNVVGRTSVEVIDRFHLDLFVEI